MNYQLIITLITIFCSVNLMNCGLFQLSLWKKYDLNRKELSLQHSNHHHFIIFHNRTQKEWKTNYHFAEERISIQFTKQKQSLTVLAKSLGIAIQGFHPMEQISISTTLFNQDNHDLLLFNNNTLIQPQFLLKTQSTITISINFDYLVFKPKDSTWFFNFQDEKTQIQQKSNDRLKNFMRSYNINQAYLSLGQRTLSNTISSICSQQFQEQSFIGFCHNSNQGKRNNPNHKIDLRYSFLIIDRLFLQYPTTSFFLFEQIIDLIQSRLFYSDGQFVQIPQHINIIRTYLRQIEKKITLVDESRLRRFNSKIKTILNGLMNQMLLADVNTLEEEMNYRENKKMHPTLIKMLSLKWKSKSLKNALSSIYEESFTPDYFYNLPNQKIDSCVSKMAWLAGVSLEYGYFLKRFGNKDDLSAMEQPKSLFRILSSVANNDNHAKMGKFYSINAAAEGARVYALHVGYESLLPYMYDISTVFPEEVLKNLTTSYGLTSLIQDHPKASSKFQFRGNIHLYFNYKILSQIKRKLQAKGMTKRASDVAEILNNLRKTIKKNWQSGKTFTMWTSDGEGLRDRANVCLLNLLMMSQNLG